MAARRARRPTACGRGPGGLAPTRPGGPETWMARLHGFSEDFSDVAFTVSGSVTGEDGAGRA